MILKFLHNVVKIMVISFKEIMKFKNIKIEI